MDLARLIGYSYSSKVNKTKHHHSQVAVKYTVFIYNTDNHIYPSSITTYKHVLSVATNDYKKTKGFQSAGAYAGYLVHTKQCVNVIVDYQM